jgi:hypothetical protein
MHVVFDLSSHGYGHAGMTSPLIAGIAERSGAIRVTVRSDIPQQTLRDRIPVSFSTAPAPPDPALAMLSPFEVDVPASARRYAGLFARWDELLAAEAAKLRALKADLVVANVPFMSLAAANACGVPAVAFAPLKLGRHVPGLLRHAARRTRDTRGDPRGVPIRARVLAN